MTEDPSANAVPRDGGPRDGAPRVSVTRLIAQAATTSKILWVEVPGREGGSHPVWFAWHDDEDPRGTGPAAYVVSGPGEQSLPWLPEEVGLVLRSKDTKGRLLRVRASAEELETDSPRWLAAAAVLRAARLNGTGDLEQRWRESGTIHVLRPLGRLEEGPGEYAATSRARLVRPSTVATARWRPWHLGGRGAGGRGAGGRRRGLRRRGGP